jgi:hypothetical protein
MATFLTTRKMDPALAARIEASVRGARGEAQESRWAPRLVSLVRLGIVLLVAGVIAFVVLARRQERRELEASRAALLETVRSKSATLTADDRSAVERMESWLARSSGPYDGDLVADELRRPGALAALLSRPAVYVRGPIDAFHSATVIAAAAAASLKDPFLLCLIEPPASHGEKAVLEKVRVAYSRTAEEHTPNVRRLHEAEVGLPFLLPPWGDRIRGAHTAEEIDDLRRDFQRAPIEGATRAVKAELMLFTMDEPGEPGGPTELDGERAHQVRVEVVDLRPEERPRAGKVLVRLRKRVDPSWISGAKRAEYASGLDGCKMALDVYESVTDGAAKSEARSAK